MVSARQKPPELRKACVAVMANGLGILAASHANSRITSQYYTDNKILVTTGFLAFRTQIYCLLFRDLQ